MHHSFDIDIAKRYGIVEAIMLNNIHFWVEKNRANEVHFHDGRYWFYNTNKAFSTLFPYLSEKQVYNAIAHLTKEGIILKGNYNKTKQDRTLWYAISDLGYSILLGGNFHFPNLENASSQNGKCVDTTNNNIPCNTDIKTNIKKQIQEETYKESVTPAQEVIDFFNEHRGEMPKVQRITPQRRSALRARLQDGTLDEIKQVILLAERSAFLQGKKAQWQATFDWLMKPSNFVKVLEGNYNKEECEKPHEKSETDKAIDKIFGGGE